VTGSLRTPVDELQWEGWSWTRSINLEGVLNGIITMLPHMKHHGEEAHIVNTGSMASHLGLAGTGDYTAAKFGVAGLSEVLRSELAGSNVAISVLCPGYTDTGLIANSRSLMPAGEAAKLDMLFGTANTTSNMSAGLDPAIVGALVRKGIEDNRFYIFSDPGFRNDVAQRYQAILEDFDWAKARLDE
jgi:NAD(P)-dependent dehydrogenase (short-subunit alcohol dehydrogenase family)